MNFINDLVEQYVQVREEIEELEEKLRVKKQEKMYLEEVMLLEGRLSFKSDLGTISIHKDQYAYVPKSSFKQLQAFLEKFGKEDEFFDTYISSTKQKKLAKFLNRLEQIPDFVNIYDKFVFTLRRRRNEREGCL